jgi:hypothetical protein
MILLTFNAFKEQVQKAFPSLLWEEVEIHFVNHTEIEGLKDLTILYTFKYDDYENGEYLVEYATSGCFYFHHKVIGEGQTVFSAIEDHYHRIDLGCQVVS